MAINHTKVHYAIGAAAIALASYGAFKPAPPPVHEAAIHQIQTPSRFDWPGLGMDKTSDLGEALKAMPSVDVKIYCSTPECHDLQLDIDDAFQIAGVKPKFEALPVESEEDVGVFVGPPGKVADFVASALREKAGLPVKIVQIGNSEGTVGIIIGKTE